MEPLSYVNSSKTSIKLTEVLLIQEMPTVSNIFFYNNGQILTYGQKIHYRQTKISIAIIKSTHNTQFEIIN